MATGFAIAQIAWLIEPHPGAAGYGELIATEPSVNVFVGVFNMFPLLPFDGGHAAIAAYERVRSRRGERYRADINKMIPLTTIVMGLMGFLLFVGLYLDITQPL